MLPTVTEEHCPGTMFGPPSLTVAVLHVTWHLVSVFVLAVVLRGFAAMWLAATAVAVWAVRREPRNILWLPVSLTWPVLALLCWPASS